MMVMDIPFLLGSRTSSSSSMDLLTKKFRHSVRVAFSKYVPRRMMLFSCWCVFVTILVPDLRDAVSVVAVVNHAKVNISRRCRAGFD